MPDRNCAAIIVQKTIGNAGFAALASMS